MTRNVVVDGSQPNGRVFAAIIYLTVLVVLALTFWGGVVWAVESLVQFLGR